MREGVGSYFSVDDRGEKETALRIHIRRRLSASGRKESRNAHRGRPTVRASQSSPLTQQAVPGACAPISNLFHVSQALSWIAGARNTIPERLEYVKTIPRLMEPLRERAT
jgi:hypothetical protein